MSSPPTRPGLAGGDPRPGEIIIGFRADSGPYLDRARAVIPDGSNLLDANDALRSVLVRLPDDAETATHIESISAKAAVAFAEQNATETIDAQTATSTEPTPTGFDPDDPYFEDQLGPQQVNAPEAWETTTGSTDVTIAILDSGVQYDHEDLAPQMDESVETHGVDFAGTDTDLGEYPDESTDPAPQQYEAGQPWWDNETEAHGTQVAGIAAAVTDNGAGVAGISNCTILAVRVLGTDEFGSTWDVADGISWAVDHGADIINLSLGSANDELDIYQTAIDYADENDVLTVGSAGNDGEEFEEYRPASQCHLAVSALQSQDETELADFSNTGEYVDIAAPGTSYINIETTYPADFDSGDPATDEYAGFSGTSMSAPIVSGVAGLVRSVDDSMSAQELADHLKDTAVDVGLDEFEQGAGRVDAEAAFAALDVRESLELSIEDASSDPTLDVGDEPSYTVTAVYLDGSEEDVTDEVTVTSTNDAVVSVDADVETITGEAAGTATLEADDGDLTTELDVTVEDEAFLELAIDDVTDPVAAGETLEVTVAAENTGDGAADRHLELTVADEQAESTPLSLEPEESTTATLTYEPGEDADETVTLAVSSSGEGTTDSETATVYTEPFLTATAESPTIDPTETAILEIETALVSTLQVENLWTDWTIEAVSGTSATPTPDPPASATDGSLELDWDEEAGYTDLTVDLSLNDDDEDPTYVGGTYGLEFVTDRDVGDTVTVSVEIAD